MKYYVDITLLPDADISLYFLWGKVYQQVHLALVEKQNDQGRVNIGAAFPEYSFGEERKFLGRKLRLFAQTEGDLSALRLADWLSRLDDYVHITSVRSVPDKPVGYAFFKRVQTKSNLDRLARRKAKSLDMSAEEALASFGNKREVYSQAPFILLSSLSSHHSFRLMIVKLETDNPGGAVEFSTYGLSSGVSASAVPLF